MNLKCAKIVFVLFGIIYLVGCSDQATVSDAPSTSTSDEEVSSQTAVRRWYDSEQVVLGRGVFAQNCAVCHGAEAQGLVEDWRVKLDDGSFPPPPLNGSAHAWHHPREVLMQVIDQGGEEIGGKMPAFAGVLGRDEKLAAIAYFQSFWSEEIYQRWMKLDGAN